VPPKTSALAATKDMNMGAAARALKKTGNEDFVSAENRSADRAYPIPFTMKAIDTAPDMHEPVFSAVKGRKGK
jgi:hypothetical protein